jgi:hypothetical protein
LAKSSDLVASATPPALVRRYATEIRRAGFCFVQQRKSSVPKAGLQKQRSQNRDHKTEIKGLGAAAMWQGRRKKILMLGESCAGGSCA